MAKVSSFLNLLIILVLLGSGINIVAMQPNMMCKVVISDSPCNKSGYDKPCMDKCLAIDPQGIGSCESAPGPQKFFCLCTYPC
ncbi:hypothetical protein TB2_007835 [Malus domestica]